jgi:hemerythrin-like domain-containing protein
MNAIETLMNEHRLIERVLDALDGYADRIGKGEEVPREDLDGFVRFIRGFADAHHHGKEEDILFKAMNEHGMPMEMGPLAVMMQEHTEARAHTATLAGVAEKSGPLDDEDGREVRRTGRAYAALLRGHIEKEDQVLYPMADQMLPEGAWTSIEKTFATFEEDPTNVARADDLRAVAATLIARYAKEA